MEVGRSLNQKKTGTHQLTAVDKKSTKRDADSIGETGVLWATGNCEPASFF